MHEKQAITPSYSASGHLSAILQVLWWYQYLKGTVELIQWPPAISALAINPFAMTDRLVEVVELCHRSWWSGVQIPIETMVVPGLLAAMVGPRLRRLRPGVWIPLTKSQLHKLLTEMMERWQYKTVHPEQLQLEENEPCVGLKKLW